MKLQYNYIISGVSCYFYLFHNGELYDAYRIWIDEAPNNIDRLEAAGYIRGYTKKDIENQKKKYEDMLDNIIG